MSKLPTAEELYESAFYDKSYDSQHGFINMKQRVVNIIESHTAAHTAALDKYNSLLIEEKQELRARVEKLESLMQEFVDRVDRGEVRSKKTYAKFKEALK